MGSGPDVPRPVRPHACPVEDWLAFLGHRWNALILWHLRAGPLRHGALQALLPGITAKVLGERLSALEARGLLVRPALSGVAAYALSASGHGLLAVLDQLEGWARHAPPA